MQQQYIDDIRSPPGARFKRALVGLAVLAFVIGAGLVLRNFIGGKAAKPVGVQQIAILKQPPPPPPKPPEKQPEPPKVKEEVKIDQPKPMDPKPDDPKPADDKPAAADKPLGVDADGSAGSDGFGLAANRGGRDITTIGGNGGGSVGASRGAYYSGLLQRQFHDALTRNRKVLRDDFRVVVRIWIADDGRVTRADIVNGSGNGEVDELIQTTLLEMAPLREVPPSSMRPIQLRLSSRS
jgi:protein TonB